jgi:hypothetical protein
MNFYKIIKDSTIIGVCTAYDFRRWQAKHNIIVVSDRDRVEAVDYNGTLYHDSWMADSGHIPYETASVTEITEEEYNMLRVQLDDGEIPDDGSLDDEVTVEEPASDPGETEMIRKTTAQILQEQIEAIALQTAGLAGASESNFVASKNYVKGDLIIIEHTMYVVTANIARGSHIIPNLNVAVTNLAEIFNSKEIRHV